MMIQSAKGRYWKLVIAISFAIAIIIVTALSRNYALAKSRSDSTLGNEIKQELIEILNRPEVSSSFNEVFQKHGILEDKTITVEFRLFDKTQLQIGDASQKEFKALAAPLPPDLLQFGSVFCSKCPPPPGKWI